MINKGFHLENLAGGAVAEKIDRAIEQIVRNIQDPNTEAKIKRRLNIAVDFAPGNTRQVASIKVAVTTKFAPAEAIDTQILMGVDMLTGELGVKEIGDQVSGQMSLADFRQPEAGAEGEADRAAVEGQPGGKPLDLKNRGPVPGKDVDPGTGEVPGEGRKIVDIGRVAAQ